VGVEAGMVVEGWHGTMSFYQIAVSFLCILKSP
jgi:hypothetical protein